VAPAPRLRREALGIEIADHVTVLARAALARIDERMAQAQTTEALAASNSEIPPPAG
jgi:hypothetical protein